MSEEEKKIKKEIKEQRKNDLYSKIANSNKQRLLTFISYFLIIAVSVASSVITIAFSGDTFSSGDFWAKLAIGLAISILGMILSMNDGKLANEDRKWGNYYDAKVRYKSTRTKISDTESFRQWNDKLYIKEKNAFVNARLSVNNIYKTNYIYLSDSDLLDLTKEPKICSYRNGEDKEIENEPFQQITEYQLNLIKTYKEGKFTFNKIEYGYFTSGVGTNSYKAEADKTRLQERRKVLSILYRIGMFVIISFIFAFMVVGAVKGEPTQIVFDTISRLFNLAMSMFFGYNLATTEARENAQSLDFKSDMIDQYAVELEIGSFTPINTDEAVLNKIKEINARKELERQEQLRKEEEARKNVIEGEVVKDKDTHIGEDEEIIEVNEEDYIKYLENKDK